MKGGVFIVIVIALLFGGIYVWGKYAEGGGSETQHVKLYYYDLAHEQSVSNNTDCSKLGLRGVTRSIERIPRNLEQTIRLLIAGEMTDVERESGLSTEFPLEGFELVVATLEQGTLTLTFEDPYFKSSGGACRASILRAEIEQTALQFPTVQRVIIMPPDILQP